MMADELERRVTALEHKVNTLWDRVDFRGKLFIGIIVPVVVAVIIAILRRTVFQE